VESFNNSFHGSYHKVDAGAIVHSKVGAVPSKYSYIVSSSVCREDYSKYQTGSKTIEPRGAEGSEILIDRLNSKLNLYIDQHRLKGEEEKEVISEWKSGEPTHRAMHLNFN
jgi:hypothetical protein